MGVADMMDREDRALGPYRALDLTEGGFNWCGKVLADLGADVIKVEPPGGSPTRRRGPFYRDDPHPERSLFWYSYCVNKRGITLSLDTRDGRELFKKLAAGADFVLESFYPGHMDSLGLGYETLGRLNPGLIMASMAPFGLTGPYAGYKATDMVGWVMGGMQYVSGDEDRPPVRIGFPQAELHAGAQALAGSMAAFWHRQNTGEGQHVDVSMEVASLFTTMTATLFPPLHKQNMERGGPRMNRNGVLVPRIIPCKDGYVTGVFSGGASGSAGTLAGLVKWMDEDGLVPDFMKDRDWPSWNLDVVRAGGEEGLKDFYTVQDQVAGFLASKTKREIFERAVEYRMLIASCNTVQDVWESRQLEAREFWVEVYHPELEASLAYLGPWIKSNDDLVSIRHRAPLIGEHNADVYAGELGLTRAQMTHLQGLGVV